MMYTSEIIDTKVAASLIGISEQAVRKKITTGKIEVDRVKSDSGRGGITYRIPLEALPVEAQVRYWARIGAAKGAAPIDGDLAGYHAYFERRELEKHGKSGGGDRALRELLTAREAVQELKGRLTGAGRRGEAYSEVAGRHGISTRTLRRWEAEYDAKGLKGLMKPTERADKGESRSICPLAGDYLKYLIVGNQQGSMDGGNTKICQETALVRLKQEAARMGDGACDRCPYCEGSETRGELSRERLKEFPPCRSAAGGRMIVPESRHAVNRYMKGIPAQLKDYGQRGGRYWEAHYMQKTRRDKPERVNECWFGDHHKFDLFVLGEDGVPFRPWLTAWADACSGEFVGWMLTAEPNSDTIAESFCRAAAYTVGSDIHGLPGAIYVDNGKDYRSERFEGGKFVERSIGRLNARLNPDGRDNAKEKSLLEYFDITMIRAKPYQAWSKTIERLFGTIEGTWIRELPGWCGDSPEERPQNLDTDIKRMAKTGDLLTFETFAKIWARKILPEYRAHRDESGRSPGEIYRTSERLNTQTPSWDTLALMKSMTDRRKVETTGIRFRNERYWDAALADYIGEYVEIRYNRGYNASITIMAGGHYICEAEVAENLKLIEPDQDKLIAHMKAQAGQRQKVTRELARLGQAMKGINTRAAYAEEIDEQRDRREATYVSLDAQRAAAGKANTVERRAGKRRKAAAGAEVVTNMFEERGKALTARYAEDE